MTDTTSMDNIIALAAYQDEKQELITEDAAALAFAERHRDQLRFDHDRGKWFSWTGKYWRLEKTKLAFTWARELARELAQNQTVKTRIVCGKTSFAVGVERFAQADRAFAVMSDLWDRNHYLLGCPDGTVDLHTGEMRAPAAEDFISKISAVSPAATADVPCGCASCTRQAEATPRWSITCNGSAAAY